MLFSLAVIESAVESAHASQSQPDEDCHGPKPSHRDQSCHLCNPSPYSSMNPRSPKRFWPVFPRWTPPGASAVTPAAMLPLGGTVATILLQKRRRHLSRRLGFSGLLLLVSE